MSILAKVKNVLGIGGVKLELTVPTELSRSEGIIQGSMVLTSGSNQQVNSVEIKLEEKWSTGRGEEKTEKTFTLGQQKLSDNFIITAGESKRFEFALPYEMIDSENDRMKGAGGVQKALGSVGSFLDAEKSEYTFSAVADVKGVLLIPSKHVNIKFK